MGKDFRLRRFIVQNLSQLTTIYSDILKFQDRVSEIDVIPSLSQNMSDSLVVEAIKYCSFQLYTKR